MSLDTVLFILLDLHLHISHMGHLKCTGMARTEVTHETEFQRDSVGGGSSQTNFRKERKSSLVDGIGCQDI